MNPLVFAATTHDDRVAPAVDMATLNKVSVRAFAIAWLSASSDWLRRKGMLVRVEEGPTPEGRVFHFKLLDCDYYLASLVVTATLGDKVTLYWSALSMNKPGMRKVVTCIGDIVIALQECTCIEP